MPRRGPSPVLIRSTSIRAKIQTPMIGRASLRSHLIGKLIASRCKEKGVESVVFDRGGYKYHGRIKSLADAAREGGLKF